MPTYLHQWTYKDQHVKKMLIEREDRERVVRTVVEAFDGTLECFYYAMGQYHGIAITTFPNEQVALACSMAIFSLGRTDSVQTTPLFTTEQGLEAMSHAGGIMNP